EKVFPAIFAWPSQFHRGKSSATNAGRRIMVDGSPKARVGGRPMFNGRPAVIRARDPFVDFFRDPANIVDEEPAGFRLHGEREWVPQPECPRRKILAGCLGEKGVVIGDGAIAIDAQQPPEERVQLLRRLAGRLVADGYVEPSVLAEVYGTALMPR